MKNNNKCYSPRCALPQSYAPQNGSDKDLQHFVSLPLIEHVIYTLTSTYPPAKRDTWVRAYTIKSQISVLLGYVL
jgi:hypothetical protein